MTKKYIENTTDQAIFVGGKLIPPGEGREFSVAELPAEHAPAQEYPLSALRSLDEDLHELLKLSVADVVKALPGMTHEGLDRAAELERDGKARSTLLAAMDAEQLARASAKVDGTDPASRAAALQAAQDALDKATKAQAKGKTALEEAQAALAKLPGNTGEVKRTQKTEAVTTAQADLAQLDAALAAAEARVAELSAPPAGAQA